MSVVPDPQADIRTLPLPHVLGALRAGERPARDRAAAEIVRRFHPLVRKYWSKHAFGEYEDFLQEVMLRVFSALPGLRGVETFPGLMRNIVIATASDLYRKKRISTVDIDDIDPDSLAQEFDEAFAVPVLVTSSLELLPPREREVLHLMYYGDLDPPEIAKRLGLTAGAVRMTRSRALRRLRDMLRVPREGGLDDAQ